MPPPSADSRAGAPVWHTFVVYTDAPGTEWFYRSGPGNPATPHHAIQETHGRYIAGTLDWDPAAPSATVQSGSAACGKNTCLESELLRIHGRCIAYDPFGPNSNTTARSLLARCSTPEAKPVPIAPGWSDPAL